MPILAQSRFPSAPKTVDGAFHLSDSLIDGSIVETDVSVSSMEPGRTDQGYETIIEFTIKGTATSTNDGTSESGKHVWGFVAGAGPHESMMMLANDIRARVSEAADGTEVALLGRTNPRIDTFYVVSGVLEKGDVVTGAAPVGDDPIAAKYSTAGEAAAALKQQV